MALVAVLFVQSIFSFVRVYTFAIVSEHVTGRSSKSPVSKDNLASVKFF